MDLSNFGKVLEDRKKNYEIRRTMITLRNNFKDREQDRDVERSEAFKTLREPLLEQQKKTDATQNRLIDELQKGQKEMIEGIQDIVTLNRELPQLPEGDQAAARPPRHARTQSAPSIQPRYDVLKGLTEEDKAVHKKYDLSPVSELVGMSEAQLRDARHIYGSKRAHKHGKPLGKLRKKVEKNTISPEEQAEMEVLIEDGKILSDYLDRLNSLLKGEKFRVGSGQPKRNAYKIQGDQHSMKRQI